MSVLDAVWQDLFGDEPVPEDADEAIDALARALIPDPEPAEPVGGDDDDDGQDDNQDGDQKSIVDELTRAVDALASMRGQLRAMEERLAYVEAQPARLPVQRAAADEQSVEDRIAELERVIRTKRLDPDSPEVAEAMRLYQQARKEGGQ